MDFIKHDFQHKTVVLNVFILLIIKNKMNKKMFTLGIAILCLLFLSMDFGSAYRGYYWSGDDSGYSYMSSRGYGYVSYVRPVYARIGVYDYYDGYYQPYRYWDYPRYDRYNYNYMPYRRYW